MPEAGAIHSINGATMATSVGVCAAELPELAARARIPLGVVGIPDRVEMAGDQRIHADTPAITLDSKDDPLTGFVRQSRVAAPDCPLCP